MCNWRKILSWQIQNDFEAFEKILQRNKCSYVIKDGVLIVIHKGPVYLSSLTSLPENVQFNNKGSVALDNLTSLPDNIQFNNNGYVYLSSLTSLPDNVQFNNRGDVYLSSLTSLPDNKYEMFHNGGVVHYNGDRQEFNPQRRETSLRFSWQMSSIENPEELIGTLVKLETYPYDFAVVVMLDFLNRYSVRVWGRWAGSAKEALEVYQNEVKTYVNEKTHTMRDRNFKNRQFVEVPIENIYKTFEVIQRVF